MILGNISFVGKMKYCEYLHIAFYFSIKNIKRFRLWRVFVNFITQYL